MARRTGSPHDSRYWAAENSLYWVMDMTFRDDECRIRTEHAPKNFVTLKHMAVNIARKAPGRDSIRLRLKTAAWDDPCFLPIRHYAMIVVQWRNWAARGTRRANVSRSVFGACRPSCSELRARKTQLVL
jgi:hypothetical protein